jgi:DnaJ-domain-containing protein 1
VNRAYQILSKSNLRAKYLLNLIGESLNERSEVLANEELLELLDLMEEATEVESEERIQQLLKENEETTKKCENEIEKSFKEQNYQELKRNVGKLNYYNRIEQILKEK